MRGKITAERPSEREAIEREKARKKEKTATRSKPTPRVKTLLKRQKQREKNHPQKTSAKFKEFQ